MFSLFIFATCTLYTGFNTFNDAAGYAHNVLKCSTSDEFDVQHEHLRQAPPLFHKSRIIQRSKS